MTLGDFLHDLIDFKCKTMSDIFKNINKKELRNNYLERVEVLREKQHQETATFAHVDLPITYYLNHSILDFIKTPPKSKVLTNSNKPKQKNKIILPNTSKKMINS